MSTVNSPTSPHGTTNMPTRTMTNEDAIPDEDTSEVSKLFSERLAAWKHACAYLEDYVTATEKMTHHHGKEYEKVLKTVNSPLKEGHHFDQQNGGIAQLFENIRANTQGIATSHQETGRTLKSAVLPIFERLHSEIKNKEKELTKGAGKTSKNVDKARNESQKSIERLGQHTSAWESSGANVKAADDPYILQRQTYHRLNKQVIEENGNRDDMIAVQNNFSQFEAHVVKTFQDGLEQFNHVMTRQSENTRTMYGDMLGMAQRIPPDFEWNGFIKRNSGVMIDPSAPKRDVGQIAFPNQDHRATQPLIAGSLEKKGKLLKKYDTAFYVVTPSKYLHEFKTDDDFAKDPYPEASLYLPDCLIGAVDGQKFNVKGKDVKGGLASKMSMSHEFAFKAHTAADALKWHQVISSVAGKVTNDAPISPVGGSESGSTLADRTHSEEKYGNPGVAGEEKYAQPAVPGEPGVGREPGLEGEKRY